MNGWTHPSVLLQSLRRTGRERPQRVVGQNDKHVCCSALLCGPCDRKCAVCAATRHLWTVTAWKKIQPEKNGRVKCGISNQYKARKAKLGFVVFVLRFCCASTYFDQFRCHFCKSHVGRNGAGNHGPFGVGQHLRVCLCPHKSL